MKRENIEQCDPTEINLHKRYKKRDAQTGKSNIFQRLILLNNVGYDWEEYLTLSI